MHPNTRIEFRQVRDVGDVLNVSFQFIRQNYLILGKGLLFIVGPFLILSSIFGTLIQILGMNLDPNALSGAELISSLGSFFAIWSVTVVLGLIATSFSVLVINGYIVLYQDYGPEGIELRDIWAMIKAHFWRVTGAAFSVVLVLIIGFPVLIIPCLGAIVYLCGFVYLLVAFSLAFPMLVREKVGVYEALRRSLALVKGYWWPTCGVLFIAGIVYAVLSTLFSTPYYMVLFSSGFFSLDGSEPGPVSSLSLIVTGLIASVGTTLLYSVPLVASAFQYYSLVERKERTGLMERIDALDESAPPPSPGRPGSGIDPAEEPTDG